MRKVIVFILAFFYLTAHSGVVVRIHYCMGKISQVKMNPFITNSCICGKGEKKMKCCSSEIKLAKVSETHKVCEAFSFVKVLEPVLSQPLNLLNTPFFNDVALTDYLINSSPPLSDQDTYLKNCVFRI